MAKQTYTIQEHLYAKIGNDPVHFPTPAVFKVSCDFDPATGELAPGGTFEFDGIESISYPKQTYSNMTVKKVGDDYVMTGTSTDHFSTLTFTLHGPDYQTNSVVMKPFNQNIVTFRADNLPNAVTACFVSGTAIRTDRGPAPVETLEIGDKVATLSGDYRSVVWLGHRVYDCRNLLRPQDVLPVRIRAGAFGDALPSRDLVVSPGHAICVDVGGEVLIPANALINGTSVVQEQVDRVTYWHVELDSHDIIFAEDLPSESYIEMGNRAFFAESRTISLLATPDAKVVTHDDFCRPFHLGGHIVDLVKDHLEARAALKAAA